ncbi:MULTISPECIES: M90 family metallopeptidase [unclassified Variovorax]|uniref:M90 family metallopeptidase n=1 Tax=unclassified Variovorax TaxID=663243 RepID=UPI002578E47B|nr:MULTISPECIES: M90 family metallopeptidase [unclassified Variovorax]MDM0086793.1 zinc-dependent peptidase [Variovorax sp. J22G40]MDM0144951.1 zinc-dependent peptidase [Variovorax sp. J2P1-31]
MFKWLRGLRAAPAIPNAAWQATLARYPFLVQPATADAARLRAMAAEFLRDKEFHGAHGFVITDEVALAVAAQAVLPVLHLRGGLDWYEDFVGIVIHPSEVVAQRKTMDEAGVVHEYEEVVAGEAMERGPVMLSWQDVLAGSLTADQGYNVVIHEFAHKIDMRDGGADGCPTLPAGFAGTSSAREAHAVWMNAVQPAYDNFREQVIVAERFGGEPTWLDPYGATSLSEFFAVACEAYFVNRAHFGRDFPEVLQLFDAFFLPARP